jgi:hypothetical protein
MVFPTNGKNHYDGIKNEKDIVTYQNANIENPFNLRFQTTFSSSVCKWEHTGGTKRKDDCTAILENGKTIEISIKNHKSGGTWDWINTSKLPTELVGIKEKVSEFKTKHKDCEIITDEIRDEISDTFDTQMDIITPEIIKTMLLEIYEKNPEYMLINDVEKKRLILFEKNNLASIMNASQYILKRSTASNKAKTSRQIWTIDALGEEKNTNLRIRFILNNGVNALLGKSKSNKISTPVLKIQQDNVDKFMSVCDNVTYCEYTDTFTTPLDYYTGEDLKPVT